MNKYFANSVPASTQSTAECAIALDQELERRGHRFSRYVDDVVILVKSAQAGRRVFASALRSNRRV
ncbi:MAG: hypothetical protein ACFE0I_05665 [Elainellaceae cyanobacterium]